MIRIDGLSVGRCHILLHIHKYGILHIIPELVWNRIHIDGVFRIWPMFGAIGSHLAAIETSQSADTLGLGLGQTRVPDFMRAHRWLRKIVKHIIDQRLRSIAYQLGLGL